MPAPMRTPSLSRSVRIGTGDRVERVVAEDVVERVIDVEAADVAEARSPR